ncbi:MAG: hypothetical protein E2O40_03750 [Planctomycetota bacterium]|nr:MAG: hypothetical protein E2O40_03750 [Planctomycetota bacterium]
MKRSLKAWLAVSFTAFGLAAIGGGGGLAWYLREHSDAFFTDADTIDRPVHESSPRDVLWRDPAGLAPVINTAADEYSPALSADGLTLYFSRRPAGDAEGGLDLFVSVKTPAGWSEPRALDTLNSEGDDLDPVLSSDGRVLYFCSNRPGGSGDYDLWMTRRVAGTWGAPVNLGSAINSRGNDIGPSLTPDDAMLYFASDRGGPGDVERRAPGALVSGVPHPDFDLYSLDLTVPDASPVPIAGLNTQHDETAPAVSPAGDFVYFASDRPGGHGGFDLYRSRRLDGAHLPALNLGAPVNTAQGELDPAVILEGFGLYFASEANAEGASSYDLRYAVSREVFTRTDTYRADLAWGPLWADLRPYLTWLVVAVTVLLLLTLLLQYFEFRKLSLLVKCVMVSLLIHMLLMVLFAFWGVSSVLSEWNRPGRGIRVVLTSPSVGSGLAGQIRATLDQPDLDVKRPASAERQLVDAVIPVDDTLVKADAQPVEASRIETAAAPVVTASALDAPATAAVLQPAATSATIAQASATELDVPDETDRTARAEASSASIPAESVQRPRAARTVPAVTVEATHAPTVTNATSVQHARIDDSAAGPLTARGHDAPSARSIPAPARPTALPDLADLEPIPVDGPSERADTNHAEASGAIEAAGLAAARTSRAQPETSVGAHGFVLAYSAVVVATPSTPAIGDPTPVAVTGPRQDIHDAGTPVPAPRTTIDAGASNPIEFALPAMQEQPRGRPRRVAEDGADVAAVASRADAPGTRSTSVMPAFDTGDVRTATQLQPAQMTYGIVPSSADTPVHDAPATTVATPGVGDVSPTVERPSAMAFDLPRLEESSVVSEPERATGLVSVPRVSSRPRWVAPTDTVQAGGDHVPSYRAEPALTTLVGVRRPYEPPMDVESDRPELDRFDMPMVASLDLDLKIPTRTAPLPDPYRHREPVVREEIIQEMGGGPETEEAVALALDWLARHQGSDGRWDGEHFDDRCRQCSGTQRVKCDVALTGLSVLCFVAADHTHINNGPYRQTVDRALKWLMKQQSPDGGLMDGESLYSHGIAAIALAEAYGMTHDPALRDAVESAMSFIYEARNRAVGGWRYRPGQAGDTSVMGWQIMALTSAKRAGLSVPEDAFRIADRWLDLVHRPSRPGTYAYQPRREVTPAMTAEGMFIRQLLGAARNEPRMRGSAAYILEHAPSWRPDANTYYWYYATLALFMHQGSAWEQWNEEIKTLLVERQRQDGRTAGSWDPDGRWAGVAGRVYQTAIATLTLEVYYRYLPLYAQQP